MSANRFKIHDRLSFLMGFLIGAGPVLLLGAIGFRPGSLKGILGLFSLATISGLFSSIVVGYSSEKGAAPSEVPDREKPPAAGSSYRLFRMAPGALFVTYLLSMNFVGIDNNSQNRWVHDYGARVERLITSQRYAEAIELGNRGLAQAATEFGRQHHLCARAHQLLAEAYQASGDTDAAITHAHAAVAVYDRYAGLSRDNIELLERLASWHAASGNSAEATRCLVEVLKRMAVWQANPSEIERVEKKIAAMPNPSG